MSESDIAAANYFMQEARRHVTAMSLTTNQYVRDVHAKWAHDSIEHAVTFIASSSK